MYVDGGGVFSLTLLMGEKGVMQKRRIYIISIHVDVDTQQL